MVTGITSQDCFRYALMNERDDWRTDEYFFNFVAYQHLAEI